MNTQVAKPDALIETYVADVMKRLPQKQRNDVGYELRALLADELRGRAGDAGRPADHDMALDLLRGFGNPDQVAARYHPPGPPIIPGNATRWFAWATFIGVGLQWATTLPMALAASDLSIIGRWWVTYGLGAFWWPGFLVTVSMIAAFIRQRWPAPHETWQPRIVDRDHISRPLYALGLAAALGGIGIWVALAWWATNTRDDTPLARVFTFDPDFLATRAPAVLLYWAFSIVLLMVLIIEGRWRKLTRGFEMGGKLACCIMLAWIS
ncbi:MAG: hypothetical protein ABMA14_21775, partial [Hyphomonadaceae bacterium]